MYYSLLTWDTGMLNTLCSVRGSFKYLPVTCPRMMNFFCPCGTTGECSQTITLWVSMAFLVIKILLSVVFSG